MRMEIKRLHQRVGTTMVYVTHDQVEAMTLATRIAVMHQGKIQQFADPQTIYDAPANLFVARFMGSPPMNIIPARLEAERDWAVAVLRSDDGRSERIQIPRRRETLTNWIGRDLLLGLRPECISLQDENDHSSDGAAAANLTGRVEMIEPTGAETMALINVAGVEAMARLKADARPMIGSRALFSIDVSKACLFDPQTELRIP
jgi:multiple sugar transport system ATP-binding protein